MKKILSLCFVLTFVNICYSQSISVSSFKLLDTDLTANTAGTIEQDQNGETAALIKVVTTQTGFTFDGGTLGIVKRNKRQEKYGYIFLKVQRRFPLSIHNLVSFAIIIFR